MKKIIAMLLAVLILVSMSAFAENAGGLLAGGWQVGESANEEVMNAYNKAFEGFAGASYEPELLIATQVVAGTNYCFLCKQTIVTAEPVTGWALVYIYVDLEGNSTVARIQDLGVSSTGLEGGYAVLEDELTEDESAAIQSVLYGGELNCDCLRVLGRQVVAGMNYKLFCVENDENGMIPQWDILTVYVDLEGNASVTEIENVEISISEPVE